jgi:hypothetical protein
MVTCVLLGQDFFIYDTNVAAYIPSIRPTANYGINLESGESLSKDEIQKLINEAEDILERELTEDEKIVLNGICLVHPEIKHTVTSGNFAIGGIGGFFADMLKSIRPKALWEGDPKKKERKKFLETFVRKNFAVYKQLEKKLGQNQSFVDWLDKADPKKVTPEDLTAINTILAVDPSYAKLLDFQHYSKEKNPFVNTVEMKVPFKKLQTDQIKTEDSWGSPKKEAEENLTRVFKGQGITDIAIEVEEKFKGKDPGSRTVYLVGTLPALTKIVDEYEIKAKDLLPPATFKVA